MQILQQTLQMIHILEEQKKYTTIGFTVKEFCISAVKVVGHTDYTIWTRISTELYKLQGLLNMYQTLQKNYNIYLVNVQNSLRIKEQSRVQCSTLE